MNSAKVYRQRAEECAQLATEATEVYVKVALSELAAEFHKLADVMERESRSHTERAADKRANHKHAA
jgi:hypothetical protein